MGLTRIYQKIRAYGTLVMFKHTIFSLSFGVVSMFLAAEGWLPWREILLILVALLSARTGANALNRVIDAQIDAENPRTAIRQLPQGIMARKEAFLFALANFAIMILAAFLINPLCAALLPLALLMMCVYSYTKRFTFLCHLFLGVTCAIAPMGAWLAVTGHFGGLTPMFEALSQFRVHDAGQIFLTAFANRDPIFIPLFLAATNALWVAGFDIIYGSQDVEHDRSHGIHSTPARFGVAKALMISRIFHFFAVIFLSLAGLFSPLLGPIYYIGIFLVAGLLVFEHIIVKPDNLTHAKVAAYNVNEVVSIVFLVFSLGGIWL